MALLEARGIDVSYYGDIIVLNDASLLAEERQVTAIIGPNGAGKSTLLKALYGLLKPKKGEIFYRNENITGARTYELIGKGMAYIPQARSVFPDLTVEENLKLGAWIFKRDRSRISHALEVVYKRFPVLASKRNDRAGMLSGGQQKMLEIGRGLITEPKVYLLDEPTATVAPIIAREIYSFVADLKNEGGTVVLVDQNIRQAFEISDYIYILELGTNKASGSRKDFAGGLKGIVRDWLDYDTV
jgi:branched-chain amino acid transport system ATP-binding protein